MKVRVYLVAVLMSCAVGCFGAAVFMVYRYAAIQQKTEQVAMQQIAQELDAASTRIGEYLVRVEQEANKLAAYISKHVGSEKELQDVLKKSLHAAQNMYCVGVAYNPFVFDQNKKLFSCAYVRADREITPLALTYDYRVDADDEQKQVNWYQHGLMQKSGWLEPYTSTMLHGPVLMYTIALYAAHDERKEKPIGVLFAGISPWTLRTFVKNVPAQQSAFLFVVSPQGRLIVYPDDTAVAQSKKLSEISGNKILKDNIPGMLANNRGQFEYSSVLSHGRISISYQKNSAHDFVVAATVFLSEVLRPAFDNLRQQVIKGVLGVILGIIFLLAALMSLYVEKKRLVRVVTVGMLLVFVAGISLLWLNERTFITKLDEQYHPLLNENAIQAMVVDQVKHGVTVLPVKVGVYILSARYLELSSVQLTGYVWQRYPAGFPTTIVRDYLMPDCFWQLVKQKVVHEKNEQEELIVWFFSGKFVQEYLTQHKFPLDSQNIRILLEHPAFHKNILFVPDSASYNTLVPQHLPGLPHDVDVGDGVALESFFVSRDQPATVNLRLSADVNRAKSTQLYFYIVVGRYLMNVIIMYLLPILLALLSLYTCIAFMSRKENKIATISAVAAVFLATALLHASMRTAQDMGGGICYLEYYYILIYALCCLVVGYVVFYESKTKIMQTVTNDDNFLMRVLVMPLCMLIMFIITVVFFYN